jgi:dethiobiotin synthetase
MSSLPANILFVTGTDTEVGKTYVCGRLLEYAQANNIKAGYQKWVCSGSDKPVPEDLEYCLQAAGQPIDPELVAEQVPFSFRFPASPHLAAAMENREVDPDVIIKKCSSLARDYDWLIVEGVGGLLVPLHHDLLLADLLGQLQPWTLLVARSGLGTINHTLLSIEAMHSRRIPVLGVVFSDAGHDENKTIVTDNQRIIRQLGHVEVFGRLQRETDQAMASEEFRPIGRAIFKQLQKNI